MLDSSAEMENIHLNFDWQKPAGKGKFLYSQGGTGGYNYRQQPDGYHEEGAEQVGGGLHVGL